MNSTATESPRRPDFPHSKPIPISTDHLRHRSASFSSDSSSSPSSPPLVTPPKNFPSTQIPISSSSPILYFLSQSPSKSPATFPFRGFPPPPVLEDEPAQDQQSLHHARRASVTGRFQPPPVQEAHHERGVNVLRRLSLSQRPKLTSAADNSQLRNPSPPPNSAVSGAPLVNDTLSNRKPRRAVTVTENSRPRRVPSPMGERILKGHFDGFN